MTIVFLVIKNTIGLRVSEAEEIAGLDIEEHGISNSYADFMITPESVEPSVKQSIAMVPKKIHTAPDDCSKLTKVVVVTNQSKFEKLKDALDQIGVTGMTITQVLGCGTQKGRSKYYRGIPLETILLPKIKIEIVISKVPLDILVDTVKRVLYTGNIGDGKIFIYDVENIIKVRTGEVGYAALQDRE